jgi:hypothetical protein
LAAKPNSSCQLTTNSFLTNSKVSADTGDDWFSPGGSIALPNREIAQRTFHQVSGWDLCSSISRLALWHFPAVIYVTFALVEIRPCKTRLSQNAPSSAIGRTFGRKEAKGHDSVQFRIRKRGRQSCPSLFKMQKFVASVQRVNPLVHSRAQSRCSTNVPRGTMSVLTSGPLALSRLSADNWGDLSGVEPSDGLRGGNL